MNVRINALHVCPYEMAIHHIKKHASGNDLSVVLSNCSYMLTGTRTYILYTIEFTGNKKVASEDCTVEFFTKRYSHDYVNGFHDSVKAILKAFNFQVKDEYKMLYVCPKCYQLAADQGWSYEGVKYCVHCFNQLKKQTDDLIEQYNTVLNSKVEAIRRDDSKPQHVYLLNLIGTDIYKIGVAIDIKKRIDALKTSHYSDIVCIESKQFKNAFQIENILHKRYKDKQLKREWFRFSKDEVLEVINALR